MKPKKGKSCPNTERTCTLYVPNNDMNMENERMGVEIAPDVELAIRRLRALQGYREMAQLYDGAIREIKTKLDILDEEFKVRYAHNPIHHMESRQKSIDSMMGKLRKKGLPLTLEAARENLYDIAGIRVICYYIDDIYRIAEMITSQGDIAPLRVRDYIAQPKENGYRSLHIVARVPVFLSQKTEIVPVEIQIRTIAMDFWASLEHRLKYKGVEDVPDGIHERLTRCAETSAMLDREMQDIYHAINGFGGLKPAQLPPRMREFLEDMRRMENEM